MGDKKEKAAAKVKAAETGALIADEAAKNEADAVKAAEKTEKNEKLVGVRTDRSVKVRNFAWAGKKLDAWGTLVSFDSRGEATVRGTTAEKLLLIDGFSAVR